MAKFELRLAGYTVSYGDYEGDYMIQDGEFVKIMKGEKSNPAAAEQVAAIRLEGKYSVIKVQS
jgi:N-dimethylarginine dimethylaminohydrolase